MSGITEFLYSRLKSLTPDSWDNFVRWIDARLRALEEQLGIERRLAENILARSLQVIEDGIGPAIIQAEKAAANVGAIADLGMVFSAPSETTVTIGTGPKTFVIPVERKNQFAPAAVIMAYAGSDYGQAVIGLTTAYNRSTGALTIEVIETKGAGVYSDWTLTPIATTEDLEELRDQVNADRTSANSSATDAVNAKTATQGYLAAFREKYLGVSATDPSTDGNGAPVGFGALYTNSTSGKLRFYGSGGWQDTTAGSNIASVEFTTDGRGTSSYPLPEAPVSKANCWVILGGVPQMRSAYNVSGATMAFTEDPGPGIFCEVTIVSQLGIGTPSNNTVGAVHLKSGETEAVITKLGLADKFPRMDGANADFSGWGTAPPGSIFDGHWQTVPLGFFAAHGQAVSRSSCPALDALCWVGATDNATAECYYRCSNSANPNGSRSPTGGYLVLPDLRGEFRRGLDEGRGVDAGRKLGSFQASQNLEHSHTATLASAGAHTHSYTQAGAGSARGGGNDDDIGFTTAQTGSAGAHTHDATIASSGGAEARPRNHAVKVIIKY